MGGPPHPRCTILRYVSVGTHPNRQLPAVEGHKKGTLTYQRPTGAAHQSGGAYGQSSSDIELLNWRCCRCYSQQQQQQQQQPRNDRTKTFQRGMLVHVVPELSGVSSMEIAEPSQPSASSFSSTLTPEVAVARIVRYFRRLLARKAAVVHRSVQRTSTVQDEAARFIQDAWRRSQSKIAMQHVRKLRAEQRLQTIRGESALMIQKLYRGHRARKIAKRAVPVS